jgi:hypothetical protein
MRQVFGRGAAGRVDRAALLHHVYLSSRHRATHHDVKRREIIGRKRFSRFTAMQRCDACVDTGTLVYGNVAQFMREFAAVETTS